MNGHRARGSSTDHVEGGLLTGAADETIRLAAQVHVPVLVTSEDPEQRHLCARLIHASGGRCRGPFVTFPVNGQHDATTTHSSVPRVAGGSGIDTDLRHRFDQARGGTLFIDDVCALTAAAQAQLLAFLDEQVPVPYSSVPFAEPDVRIVAGASRHVDTERAAGAFSQALFYRLNVIHGDLGNERA